MELTPINGHLVTDEHAHRVVAPPYDALTPQQRRAYVADEPDSYLAVLPAAGDRFDDRDANCDALARLVTAGCFEPLPAPALLIQELTTQHGRIRAVLGDLPALAYRDGRVRPHESVRADRVRALADHLRCVGVVSSPVSVIHPPDPRVTRLTDAHVTAPPAVDAVLADGTRLRVWAVTDPDAQATLAGALAAAGPLTVADGHHRAAAVGAALGDDGPVLTAASPADHLDVLAFHRRIVGLDDVEVASVRAALPAPLRPLDGPDAAPTRGTVHLAVDGRWFALELPMDAADDPVATLDAARAQTSVIDPLRALATDPDAVTIQPVPATAGAEPLAEPGGVGVALHPPSIDELLAVAAAGAAMPFKSTYLVPKLRSGVVVVPRTDAAPARLRAAGPAATGASRHRPGPAGREHHTAMDLGDDVDSGP